MGDNDFVAAEGCLEARQIFVLRHFLAENVTFLWICQNGIDKSLGFSSSGDFAGGGIVKLSQYLSLCCDGGIDKVDNLDWFS